MSPTLKRALLEHGVPQRIIDLSEQPYIRPGAVDIDQKYMLAVLDAQDTVDLHVLSIKKPGVPVCWPPHYPRMGLVPH